MFKHAKSLRRVGAQAILSAALLFAAAGPLAVVPTPAFAADAPQQNAVRPNSAQYKYQKDELAAFCHFGPNTFNEIEWGEHYGNKAPSEIFTLTEDFDAENYVKTIKEAGFTRLVVTAKHHDGFCTWQSDLTEYDMGGVTQYKGGKGDILAELSAACTKYDLDMGLYLSPWDIHDPSYGYSNGEAPGIGTSTDPKVNYNFYYDGQLREILGNSKYGNNGKFVEVWMDGAKGSGANAQVYDFQRWYNTIHELEGDDCQIFQGGDFAGIRWIGNENGLAHDTTWGPCKTDKNAKDGFNTNLSGGYSKGFPDGDKWLVPEADARITSGWFWGTTKNTPKTLTDLGNMYFQSVGHGAPLLLNVPPNNKGKLDAAIADRVREFGQNIKDSFKDDLTRANKSGRAAATAEASSTWNDNEAYGASKVLDGKDDTYWCAKNAANQSLTVKLPKPTTFDVVSIEEAIQNGQRISGFTVSYQTEENGAWTEFGRGGTIGAKRLVRGTAVTATAVKVTFTTHNFGDENLNLPQISEMGLFKASRGFEKPAPLPEGMVGIDNAEMTKTGNWNDEKIDGCFKGTSMWTTQSGATASFKFTGTKFAIVGTKDPNHGTFTVSIDGGAAQTINTHDSVRTVPALLFESDTLEAREHNVVVTATGTVGIDAAAYLNNGSTGMFDFTETNVTMDEDSTHAFTIRRTGGSKGSVTLVVQPEPGSAIQDNFDTTPQEVTFADGETEKQVNIKTRRVVTGSAADGDKQFSVSLAVKTGEGAVIGYHGVADVTITDLDAACNALIARAEALDTSNFNADSVAELTAAIEAARNAADNGDVKGVEVRKAMKALQDAMDNLSFAFPATQSKTVTIEAEHGTMHDDHSNDAGWPMAIIDFAGASGGKIVNAITNGDSISYRVSVKRAGTYSVTLTYSSGAASNAIKLSDDNGVFEAIDSVSAGHTNPNELKTVTFDLVAKKSGTTTLTVGTPGNADAPRLDKFDITLKEAAVDKSDLQKAVDKADELSSEDYTTDSWQAFQTALTAAREMLNNETATQTQVDGALETLDNARKALHAVTVFAFPTKSGETATIEAEDGTMLDDHSNDTDKWNNTYPMTVMNLNGASGGKVVDAIMNGDAISYRVKVERPGTYRVTLTYFSGSEANAVKLSDNGGVFEAVDSVSAGGTNPTELKTVTFDLVAKKAGTTTLTVGTPGSASAPRLDKFDITLAAPAVDKAELQKAIDDAAKLAEDDYTAETWAPFKAALAAAQGVLTDEDATQEQVNDALKALNDARGALAEKPVKPAVDKAALQKAVDDAAELAEDGYTAETWAPFKAALAAAQGVLTDEDATQEQVNDALKALNDARGALAEKPVKPAVDKADLQKAVDDAAELAADDYTADSWKPFAAALKAAREVLADEEATQDQVNDALKALTDAHGALKVKEVTPDPEPEPKPEPTPNPGGNTGNAGNKDDKPAAATKPSTSSKKDGKDLPTTGDASVIATVLAGGSGAAALAAARVIDRKRRR